MLLCAAARVQRSSCHFSQIKNQGRKVAADKKTMYEILNVASDAPLAEIKAAHRRLSLQIMTEKNDLSREEREFQLKLLDIALDTLSDPASRDAYDAKLALEAAPGGLSLAGTALVSATIPEEKAHQLAAAIVDDYKTSLASIDERPLQIQAIKSTLGASASALRTILRIVAGLIVLGFVLKMGQLALAARKPGLPPAAVARAEEKLIIQQYYRKHGVRPASRAEAELLEQQHRLKENEVRQAEFEKEKEESELRRFDEESREIGERVHREYARAQEQARYEEMLRQQELQRQREAQLEPFRQQQNESYLQQQDEPVQE